MLVAVSDVQDTNMPQSGLEAALSDDSYDQWVSRYGMREKVACTPELREELKDPAVSANLSGRLVLTLGYIGNKTFIRCVRGCFVCRTGLPGRQSLDPTIGRPRLQFSFRVVQWGNYV